MKVADVMDSRFQFVRPETPIWKAQDIMLRRQLNCLVVSETGDRLDGLVTHTDVFRKLLPSQTEYMEKAEIRAVTEAIQDRYKEVYRLEISSIMTTVLTSVKPETPLVRAGALMNARRVKQLPVLEGERLVGVVSSRDVSAGILLEFYGLEH